MKGSNERRRHADPVDPTIYPEEEKVGEDMLQRLIMELLRPLLQRWLTLRGVVALVGADQFMYYRKHDSTARVAPDIYVLPGVAPGTPVRVWKIWEKGIVPSFALELVSQDGDKDYFEAPSRYDRLGVPELVVFDPYHAERRDGVRWQIFRRIAHRGLVCVEVSQADRVRSKQLKCWLRCVGEGNSTRVRIAVGPRGDELVPTEAEAERAERERERAATEQERAALAQERSAREQERAAKEAALARVRELEEKLRRLTRRGRR